MALIKFFKNAALIQRWQRLFEGGIYLKVGRNKELL